MGKTHGVSRLEQPVDHEGIRRRLLYDELDRPVTIHFRDSIGQTRIIQDDLPPPPRGGFVQSGSIELWRLSGGECQALAGSQYFTGWPARAPWIGRKTR